MLGTLQRVAMELDRAGTSTRDGTAGARRANVPKTAASWFDTTTAYVGARDRTTKPSPACVVLSRAASPRLSSRPACRPSAWFPSAPIHLRSGCGITLFFARTVDARRRSSQHLHTMAVTVRRVTIAIGKEEFAWASKLAKRERQRKAWDELQEWLLDGRPPTAAELEAARRELDGEK